MIRHQTSYWLTLRPGSLSASQFQEFAARMARAMEPFGILPDPDSEPDVMFQVAPERGTIESTSEVGDAASGVSNEFPKAYAHLLIQDEEDKSSQCSILYHDGKSTVAPASVQDSPDINEMIRRAENPARADAARAADLCEQAADLLRGLAGSDPNMAGIAAILLAAKDGILRWSFRKE